jgi:hypothetical protein
MTIFQASKLPRGREERKEKNNNDCVQKLDLCKEGRAEL